MHHEDIKAAIRKQGVTPRQIAKHLHVGDQTVSAVIRGATKSERVAKAIAKVTGLTVDAMWPGLYAPTQGGDQRVAALLGATTKRQRAA